MTDKQKYKVGKEVKMQEEESASLNFHVSVKRRQIKEGREIGEMSVRNNNRAKQMKEARKKKLHGEYVTGGALVCQGNRRKEGENRARR